MDFQTWESVYERILADFGYDRPGDERARDVLDELLGDSTVYESDAGAFEGNTVAIAGGGPNLGDDLALVSDADTVVAASVAAKRVAEHGFSVDVMVTDLDKVPEVARDYTHEGTPVAVHAHGDNVPALREHVPEFEQTAVLPTTQAEPTDLVRNFGGFTDGDRGAFLADHLGADRLVFPGWEFDDPSVGPEKAQKLRWAERLLLWLERRRGEQFAVLDGRRDAIDDDPLPDNE
jgi:uncharacterized Rossmann fold enzyme